MLTSSVLVALFPLAGAAAEPARAPAAFQHDHTAAERAQRGATQLQVLRAEADKQGEAGAPQASCWAAAVAELEPSSGRDQQTPYNTVHSFGWLPASENYCLW